MNDEYIREINRLSGEVEELKTKLEEVSTRINDTRDNISHSFSFWGIMTGVIALLFSGMQIGIAIILYLLSQ